MSERVSVELDTADPSWEHRYGGTACPSCRGLAVSVRDVTARARNDNGPSMSLGRSVFEPTPGAIAPLEALTGIELGVGRAVPEITDELLEALTEAYREAAKGMSAETARSGNGLDA